MNPFLQVRNIGKTFPGVQALTDVSIDFYSGEIHSLLGENGAGKSTLIKIISGVHTPDKGFIVIDGKECVFSNPRQAMDNGIAVIHQELSIANHLSVAENIYLGGEPRIGKSCVLDRKKMESDAQKILDFMEVDIKADIIAYKLTAAQQQIVEIAKVISKNAKVIIMDEPTSSLSSHEIKALFKQIGNLKKNKVSVIYITHRLKEIFEIADKVTVLRDGCKVNSFLVQNVSEKQLVANMVGREMKDYYNKHVHRRGAQMLRVENLSCGNEFSDISFTAYAGEILGFSGLIGAGRTEVMETIFGVRKAVSGTIYIEGKKCIFSSPSQAIRAKIGMVTEDRRRTGLMINAMLKDNIVLPSLQVHHKRGGVLDSKWERMVTTDYITKLKIKTPSIDTVVSALSGGNQQKVVLAKWLIANSRILILDEPTRGIDVNAKSEFYALMNEFVGQGGCIIMVSSDLSEILGISDRILVMSEGKLCGELDNKGATEKKIMEMVSLHTGNTNL